MAVKEITITFCECEVCGEPWITRDAESLVCPFCMSSEWNLEAGIPKNEIFLPI